MINLKRKRTNFCKPSLHIISSIIIKTILLAPCYGMIYLEDPTLAIKFDALPKYSQSSIDSLTGIDDSISLPQWMIDELIEEFNIDGSEEAFVIPFKLGTPDHYLTYAPSPTPNSSTFNDMSGSPTHRPSEDALLQSNSPTYNTTTDILLSDLLEEFNNSVDDIIDDINNSTSSSSLFDRRSLLDNSTSSIPSVQSTISNEPTQPTSTTTTSPSISNKPTKSPSVIHEITGEYTDNFFHPYHPDNEEDDNGKEGEMKSMEYMFTYFNDMKLLGLTPDVEESIPEEEEKVDGRPQLDDTETEDATKSNIIYYDTKQARFGTNLGPLGNAAFVNIMLPPVYYGSYWNKHVVVNNKEKEYIEWENINEVVFDNDVDVDLSNETDDIELDDGLTESIFDDGNATITTVDNVTNTTSALPSKEIESNTALTTPGMVTTLTESEEQLDSTHQLESADEMLGLADPGNEYSSNNIEDESVSNGIFDDKINTTLIENETIIDNETIPTSTTDIKDGLLNFSPPPQKNGIPISTYFCLEDFVNWRIEQRNNNSSSSNKPQYMRDNTPTITVNVTNSTIPNISNEQHNPNFTESTRPITIIAQRGRCSFESKARMAMVLNDLFENSGRSNRIEHIIIYNNGTDNDNNTQNDEALIDMSLVSTFTTPVDETGGISVGLLYVNTNSGEDIIRRMKDREELTQVDSHVDVSMLFPEDDNKSDRSSNNPRHTSDTVDEANIDNGEHDGGQGTDNNSGFHDTQVSHGWYFPATLTRFCLSCGKENMYGMVWNNKGAIFGEVDPSFPRPGDIFPNIPVDNDDHPYTIDYYERPWLEYIRKLMVAILAILLIGPVLLAARRWYTVGGTLRITVDENGRRRVRVISPNLEVFVNGVRDTVETNGTKLDRSQVFALPEIEYAGVTDEEQNNPSDYNNIGDENQAEIVKEDEEGVPLNTTIEESIEPSIPISPTRESETSSRFVSSSCCSICLDEFRSGEVLRLLPRCDHAFHTECILPWLTERQGCCPMCKVPVLPDEQQRSRSRTPRRRRRRLRSNRRGRPQTATTEESSPEREDSETPIISGIRLVSEVGSDLDAAYPNQGIVTPDSSPVSTSYTDDLIILEEGQPLSQDPSARSNHEESEETPHDIVRNLSIFYDTEEPPDTDEGV